MWWIIINIYLGWSLLQIMRIFINQSQNDKETIIFIILVKNV